MTRISVTPSRGCVKGDVYLHVAVAVEVHEDDHVVYVDET
jgi:hypothetical protein